MGTWHMHAASAASAASAARLHRLHRLHRQRLRLGWRHLKKAEGASGWWHWWFAAGGRRCCCGGRFRERRNLGGVEIELLAGPHAHELAQPPQLPRALARARGSAESAVSRAARRIDASCGNAASRKRSDARRAQQRVVDHVEEVQHVDVVLRPRQRRQRLGAAPERHEHRRGLPGGPRSTRDTLLWNPSNPTALRSSR